MELDYLKEFIAAAQICNMFETSEQMFISQSTLSRHIKRLEESVGVELFDRTPKSIQINRNGQIFLEYAKKLLDIEQEARRALELEQENHQDIINIATVNSVSNYRINEILSSFKQSYPQYSINIYEGDSSVNLESLRKRECDFAFAAEAAMEGEEYECIPFTRDELAAVFQSDHLQTSQDRISIGNLKGQPLLLYGRSSTIYKLCTEILKQYGIEPQIAFTSYRSETIVNMVDKGMGTAMMLRKEAEACNLDGKQLATFTPEIHVDIRLWYRKESQMRKISRDFLSCVKKCIEEF